VFKKNLELWNIKSTLATKELSLDDSTCSIEKGSEDARRNHIQVNMSTFW
jgi:hypothetical protein